VNGLQKNTAKGVPRSIPLKRAQYLDTLYDRTAAHYGTHDSFVFKRQTTQMATVKVTKKLLNSNYTKFCVMPDKVTLIPLNINGQFI